MHDAGLTRESFRGQFRFPRARQRGRDRGNWTGHLAAHASHGCSASKSCSCPAELTSVTNFVVRMRKRFGSASELERCCLPDILPASADAAPLESPYGELSRSARFAPSAASPCGFGYKQGAPNGAGGGFEVFRW